MLKSKHSSEVVMKCKICGIENYDNEKICGYCGAALKLSASTIPMIIYFIVFIILKITLKDFSKTHAFEYFIGYTLFCLVGIYICIRAYIYGRKSRNIRKKNNINIKELINAKNKEEMDICREIPLTIINDNSKNTPCVLIIEDAYFYIKKEDLQEQDIKRILISDISKIEVTKIKKFKGVKILHIIFWLKNNEKLLFSADDISAFFIGFFAERYQIPIEKIIKHK